MLGREDFQAEGTEGESPAGLGCASKEERRPVWLERSRRKGQHRLEGHRQESDFVLSSVGSPQEFLVGSNEVSLAVEWSEWGR